MSEGGLVVEGVPEEIQGNIALVHRILLTDASDFGSLTVSGHPALLETPPYGAFAASLEKSQEEVEGVVNINAMVKGAFRDKLCESIGEKHDWTEAMDLLCELHKLIRNLVPARKDLHSILDDNEAKRVQNLVQLKSMVIKAGTALQSLESPARSETTAAWIRTFSEKDFSANEFAQDSIQSLINGMLYLLFKTELCEADKQNYYLAAVWAPILQKEGPRLERIAFQKDYGSFQNPATAPATRKWVQSLVEKQTEAEISALLVSKGLRWNLIRTGWIEDILFRSADSSALSIPEVLARDAGRLQGLRHITRMAAAGSALALLACQAANQPPEVLYESEKDDSSLLSRRRKVLIQVMADHFKSPVDYEQGIGNAVIAIARIWKPDLDVRGIEGLLHRTKKVLKVEDPVIQVLDGRMKECFRELAIQAPTETALPSHIQAGAVSRSQTHVISNEKETFLKKATALFKSRGLAFYAPDLSSAARFASRVIDLALKLYGDDLVDKMILDACQNSMSGVSSCD